MSLTYFYQAEPGKEGLLQKDTPAAAAHHAVGATYLFQSVGGFKRFTAAFRGLFGGLFIFHVILRI